MKTQLTKMKADLKILAEQLKTGKFETHWLDTKYRYRSKHIAYCLLRGRTLGQIEPKIHGSPNDYHHWRARKEAARLVAEVLNPAPVVPQPVEVKKESLWTKVLNSLS